MADDSWSAPEVMIPGLLAHRVRDQIRAYLTTTYNFTDSDYRQRLEDFFMGEDGLFKGPYIDIKLPFRAAPPDTVLPLEVGGRFPSYLHQLRAWRRLSTRGDAARSTIVATGTGSGKTECFLYPILDHALRAKRQTGVQAILFYPMNALAFDQARRLAKEIAQNLKLSHVRAGLIAGEDDTDTPRKGRKVMSHEGIIDDRDTLIKDPPHILLTNYKMMDVMLQSPAFEPFWQALTKERAEALRYLVFDEMHTYDAAQGADVALLVRRLKAKLGIESGKLICVGTSATLATSSDGSAKLLTFARRLFGEEFDDDCIVTEERQTVDEVFADIKMGKNFVPSDSPALGHALHETVSELAVKLQNAWFGVPKSSATELGQEIIRHPLTKEILSCLGGRPLSESELLGRVARKGFSLTSRQLHSFLALLAQSRRGIKVSAGGEKVVEQPLFHVRVQLWLRELTALLVKVVGRGELFVWNNPKGAAKPSQNIYLPPVFCEECGLAGLAAKASRVGAGLELRNLKAILDARFDRAASVRYLFPWTAEAPEIAQEMGHSLIVKLCTDCGAPHLGEESECRSCKGQLTSFLSFVALTEKRGKGVQRDRRRCPACSCDGSIRSLSARLNTLTSIAASEVFLSRLSPSAGKRLLVFADSVQDASHRAGYLNARTYRFTMRTAMQAVMATKEGSRCSFAELARELFSYWREKKGEDYAVAMLTPGDFLMNQAFADYQLGKKETFLDLLRQRLNWEVYLEYCLRSQVGRTLEKTLSSVAVFSHPQEKELIAKAFELVVNKMGRGDLQDAGPAAFESLWRGIAKRLLHKGAVALPGVFDSYRKTGKGWSLSKAQKPWINALPLGRIREGMEVGQLPNFPSTNESHRIFDFIGAPTHGRSWLQDWLLKHMLSNEARSPADITASLQAAFAALAEVGLLDRVGEERGGGANYALNPDFVEISCHPILLKCGVCRDAIHVGGNQRDEFINSRCRRLRCPGTYQAAEYGPSLEFYRGLYGSGQTERIFATEHTGILRRAEREALETVFKSEDSQRRPSDVNLLSCTSTLEMGIDIGDLGATIAAGLPRTTANYQQRIGRAGRASGSAFITAIAAAKPRDLVYFSEPEELVAGHIDPPGCFLDAPDILRRQFAAFLFESHGAQLRGKRKKLTISSLIEDREKAGAHGFWLVLQEILQGENVELLQRFRAACHLGDIEDETWRQLEKEWLTPDPQSGDCRLIKELKETIDTFAGAKRELDGEKIEIRKLVVELEARPTLSQEAQDELKQARIQLATIEADLEAMGAKGESLHGFLVRKGFLPNYAFGDDDVELITYRRQRAAVDGPAFEQQRFVRGAGTALRDFAPGNTFYGGGRQVEINTLDLGKDSKRHVEDWRYCPECAHLARNREEEAGKRCPMCGSPNWGDTGSRMQMVKLRRVKSVVHDHTQPAGDASETRHSEFYRTRKFFDGRADNMEGVNDETFTMAIEFVPRMLMREINFGFSDSLFQGQSLRITGDELPRGFNVCHACGRLSDDAGKVHHTQACPRNQAIPKVKGKQLGPATMKADPPLLLYRELVSEAVRVHVPVRAFSSAEKMASYQAALLLGLRAHFGGLPDHLVIEREKSINPEDQIEQYALVIFDSVPGGSGFMKSLTTKDSFFAMAKKALRTLHDCPCSVAEGKDGCIRCVYGVVAQRDIPIVSRRMAMDFLTRAIEREGDFKTIHAADMRHQLCTESELEAKFADILDSCSTDPVLVKWLDDLNIKIEQSTVLLAHKGGGTLVLTDRETNTKSTWHVELQRTIRDKSSALHTRPDVVLTKQGADAKGVRPIALYLDGFAYHASKASGDCLSDDFEKRSNLSLGEANVRMRVWNLDWNTTFADRASTSQDSLTWFGLPSGNVGGEFALDPLSLLFCILARGGDNKNGGFSCKEVENELKLLSRSQSLNTKLETSLLPDACRAKLLSAGANVECFKPTMAGSACDNALFSIIAENNTSTITYYGVLRWDVSEIDRESENFKMNWRCFLATHNVLGMLTSGVASVVVGSASSGG